MIKFYKILFLYVAAILAVNGQPALSGDAAIASLGSELAQVASTYKMDTDYLIKLLKSQPSLKVSRDKTLFYVCEAKPLPANNVSSIILPTNFDNVFALHSFPGATRRVYLDFNGHTTENTTWNSGYTKGVPIVSAPFNLDGDPNTYNDAEKAIIVEVWKRVSEDFAPFFVDVTTEDPGVEALRKTTSSDNSYGIRVVISPTNFYGAQAGGVASIGSFSSTVDHPCFAFTDQLQNNARYISDAVSHEVGHTVGLFHDGVINGPEYYEGQGDWSPIMGVTYYRNMGQFSKGEYSGANNTQDDLAVIATYIPFASDDHGNSLSVASPLYGPSVGNGGTIENRNDVDLFVLNLGSGVLSINVTTAEPSPNLNLKTELLNSSGVVINTGNSINLFLSAGIYYLKLDGIGSGDPLTDGYSDYGSIGNYIITGTLVPGSGTPPQQIAADVSTFNLTLTTARQGSQVFGEVIVLDQSGAPVANAIVYASWSGILTGSSTATTNSAGKATFNTQRTKKAGDLVVSVNNITGNGIVYNPSIYTTSTVKIISLNK